MNHQNIAILVLGISAALLAALLVGSYTSDNAVAGTASVKGGDYIMQTMQYKELQDMLIVTDVSAQRMNFYIPDKTGTPKNLDLEGTKDLKREFPDKGR